MGGRSSHDFVVIRKKMKKYIYKMSQREKNKKSRASLVGDQSCLVPEDIGAKADQHEATRQEYRWGLW